MGIGDDDPNHLTNNERGWARAYKADPTAFRCVDVRASTLANIPLRLEDAKGNEVTQHPLRDAFGPRNTRLRYVTESDLLVYGRAFWEFARDRARPDQVRIKRLNPSTIEIVADRQGLHGFRQILDGQVHAEWPREYLVYFTSYDPEDDFGYVSLTQRALKSISVSLSITAFADYFFINGAMPDGILTTEVKLQTADKERILGEWRRQFQGVENAHGTALLDGPAGSRITYQPLTAPIKDLAMPELRQGAQRETAKSYGVPPTIAMIENAANYATADSERKSLYTETVLPALDSMLDAINTQLMPRMGDGVTVEAVLDEIDALQEDRTEITQRAAQGVGAGYLSLNDARDLEGQDLLKTDYLIMGGKVVPRDVLESGDLETLREWGVVGQPAQLGGGFFGALPPVQSEAVSTPPPFVIDNPPQKAIVDIVVHATDRDHAARTSETVIADTMHKDLERWRKKIANKGVDIPFEPNYLPAALTGFLRADVLAWDGETDRAAWIDNAFDRAAKAVNGLVKLDDASATPEEFEAYWSGIDILFDLVGAAFEDQFDDLRTQLSDALRTSGAALDLTAFLANHAPTIVDALVGTDSDPGPLTRVMLAGAARGNDLLRGMTKQADLTIDWTVMNETAREWARQFAGTLITGINETTEEIIRAKVAEWIEAGGSLEQLADYIEGTLPDLDIPEGWSPGKLDWATSRSRARLIAQTETTRAFTEGNFARWQQVGVEQVEWRTQRDSDVCKEICRLLHGVIGTIAAGWVHPGTGITYRMPAHPGCRCFPRPKTGRV
jgi:HK97 family phage portal protein